MSPTWQIQSRTARLVGVLMALALVAGAAGLALTHNSNPASGAMPAHIAKVLSALPTNAQDAASHTVDLTITTPGHTENLAAMVIAHDLAVTTTPIAPDALITGSVPSHLNFPVTLVGRDGVMGFSIVHLGIHVPALTFAPLPASTSVVAVSPIERGSTKPPQYAWAHTTLGDPAVVADGVVSYLATRSDANLNGFVDAVAINQGGSVVAVLSASHLWFSAQFVARVATIVATGRGCHASLGVVGTSDQGGGVLISRIVPKSPAQWHFQVGDVITQINGHNTDTLNELTTALYLTPAYSRAQVSFVRHTSVRTTVVTLGCGP